MQEQMSYIASRPWQFLVIMDAARYDTFARLCVWGGKVEELHSPADETAPWMEVVLPVLDALKVPVVYLSANPVADRLFEMFQQSCGQTAIRLVSLWQYLWGWHGRGVSAATVHPHIAVGAAVEIIRQEAAPESTRYILHLVTPHHPFIGEPPLDTSHWTKDDKIQGYSFGQLMLTRGLAGGNPELWAKAYEGNLVLGWDAVKNLPRFLGKPVTVTSDHGELLGEDNLYGHGIGHPILHKVPWLEMDAVTTVATPENMIKERLEALGYA